MGSSASKKSMSEECTVLAQAQNLKVTRTGQPVDGRKTAKMLTKKELQTMRQMTTLPMDVLIILNPPFSLVDRITDNLYLTGIGGIVKENMNHLKVNCIINVTIEMPLLQLKDIVSFRVPVDDDESEVISIYFDDVTNVIHDIAKRGGRSIVHCMAGASRSSTLVLAYLIKYQDYTLKNAFCYLKSLRSCARPNLGFMAQLIEYERFYKQQSSVEIVESFIEGRVVRVPDFYKRQFPSLWKAEVNKQIAKSHISQMRLQEGENYMNRKRRYREMQRDIDVSNTSSHIHNKKSSHAESQSEAK